MAGANALRVAARRDEPHACPLAGSAGDVEAAAEQCEPLADAEKPPSHLAGLRPVVESCRIEPDALIGNGDAQLVVGVERQLQRDAIHLRVFHRIEQEFSDRLDKERADVFPRGIGPRVGDQPNLELWNCRVSSRPATTSPRAVRNRCSTGG